MTISVSNNPDGTITVTCGAESVTVGTKTSVKQFTSASGDDGGYPHITPSGSGVTASLIAPFGPVLVRNMQVTSEDEIAGAIREVLRPTVLSFEWKSEDSIDLNSISAALRERANEPPVYCEIHFPTLDD